MLAWRRDECSFEGPLCIEVENSVFLRVIISKLDNSKYMYTYVNIAPNINSNALLVIIIGCSYPGNEV